MKFCKLCVLPDSRPGIEINDVGICNACIGAKEKKEEIDWIQREKDLKELLELYKGKSDYDCIIPVSGGKDSTWQVYTIKEKFKLKPLAITYKPPCRTELGKKNLRNLINLGVDHIDFTPNPEIERKFMLKALIKSGSAGLVHHLGAWALCLKFAVKFDIKLIIWGENPGLEYGGNKKDRQNCFLDNKWIKKYGATNGTFVEDWIDEDLTMKDLSSFQIPTDNKLKQAQIQSIFLGWYLKWDPKEVAEISKSIGFTWADKPVLGLYPYADLDDDLIVIHHFIKWYKFGITRVCDNLSIEIRNRRMTRNQAIDYLKNTGEPYPKKQIESICKYLKITKNEFWDILEKHRNLNIWSKNENGEWYLPAFQQEFGFQPKFIK